MGGFCSVNEPVVLLLELSQSLDYILDLSLNRDENRSIANWAVGSQGHEIVRVLARSDTKIRLRFILPDLIEQTAVAACQGEAGFEGLGWVGLASDDLGARLDRTTYRVKSSGAYESINSILLAIHHATFLGDTRDLAVDHFHFRM